MAARPVTVSRVPELKSGELAVIDVEGTPVALANVDGRLFAFGDTCTHEECSLAEGVLDGTIVTCPCHGAQFDVTSGQVVAPPAYMPVKSYPVRVEGGHLVVEV